ncbi:hypothetical protein CW712_02960 [Candidatus Bathyarchaeota archaeon]|nr:MAG: hypothetical protein CW712_02960 [Candidatus Bathyarchaeota archaeon]
MRKRSRLPRSTDEFNLDVPDTQMRDSETCMNPWNGKCSNTDIALYIVFKGNRLPICRKCWEEISSKDIEWMYD